MTRKITIEIISSLLIMLFLYAALSKWLDIKAFIRAMHNQPFPHWLSTLFIWTVPPLEIIIAILLMMKKTQRVGLVASFILMCAFTLYVGAILLHLFPRVPCSCGGVIKNLGWVQHLFFNLFFVAISLVGIMLSDGRGIIFNWNLKRNAETA